MPSPKARVRVVRRKLADGTVKEYRYAVAARPPRHHRFAPDSLGALIIAYRMSPEWLNLSTTTKSENSRYLAELEKLAEYPVDRLTRRMIVTMRNGFAARGAPAAANRFAQVTKRLLGWAVEADWLAHSPAVRIKPLPGGHLATWTRDEADIAAAKLPEFLRRVVILARYSGQRRGDLVKMRWADYDGTTLRVQQQKQKRPHDAPPLRIPVHQILKVELDAWKRGATSTHILTGKQGRPLAAHSLSTMMRRNLAAIGLRDELNNHGLRKLAATELAEAGCTAHEIAAVTGHKTLAMVQLYTAAVDQERLAGAAIVKLDDARKTRLRKRVV